MIETTYLSNQFLIAMPGLADPNFFQTVTYICEHDASGAMGIIINRPLNLNLGDLLQHLDIPAIVGARAIHLPLYAGGPVQQEQGFVLHTPIGPWDSSLQITDQLAITTSRDILHALARNEGPEQALVALGYAGWGPGQLEQEMAANAWLSGPADPNILFHLANEDRWSAAAALLGVDLTLLSADSGHA